MTKTNSVKKQAHHTTPCEAWFSAHALHIEVEQNLSGEGLTFSVTGTLMPRRRAHKIAPHPMVVRCEEVEDKYDVIDIVNELRFVAGMFENPPIKTQVESNIVMPGYEEVLS